MRNRLSLPGLVALAIGIVSFVSEFHYGTLSERMAVIGYRGLGTVMAYTLGVLGTIVGVQQLATKALSDKKTSTIIRSRVFFPVEGRVYLAMMSVLFVGAIVGKSNPLLLVFCLMATPWIFNGFIAYTQLRLISVARELPDRGEAGQVLAISVILTNKRRFLPVWMFTVRDQIDGPIGAGIRMKQPLEPQVAFLRLAAGKRQRRVYRVRLPKRGRYEFGPLQADTRFPLGLIERGLVIPDRGEILVHPRIGSMSPEWRRRLVQAREQVSRATPKAGSFDDDFHRVREYQTGDDPRAIHWPTSARRGSLVVREFRESRDRPLAILVDLCSTDGHEDDRVELALDLAATIAVEHSRNSQRAGVYCGVGASDITEWSSSSRADLGGLLDHLAVVTPFSLASGSTDPTEKLLANWSERGRRDERVVWITTRNEGPSSALLPYEMDVLVADREIVSTLCEWRTPDEDRAAID